MATLTLKVKINIDVPFWLMPYLKMRIAFLKLRGKSIDFDAIVEEHMKHVKIEVEECRL